LCGKQMKITPHWQLLFLRYPPVVCKRCEQQFEKTEEQALKNEVDLSVKSLFHYNYAMVDYLQRYKFMHDTVLANVFRQHIYEALKNSVVVPIPMHPKKLIERTFSPVELLLKCADIQYEQLLTKITTETQSSKTKEERLQTPQIFELIRKPEVKSYTIFDDIVTTGMTLKHAKTLLLEHGARDVQCVTLIKA
ncbi:MAG: phosphoribosyltransferase family protein, partial [Lysinibacillus sp.]